MNARNGAGTLASLILVCCLAGSTPAHAQTHFIDVIAPSATPVFQNLGTFTTPAGAGSSRLTFIKLVTNATNPTLQVQRTPGVTAQVVPDAAPEPDDNIVEGAVATQVANVVAVSAGAAPFCAAVTVAAGYRAICIVVTYDDAYSFTAAETWQLNALEDAASSFEYFGWVGAAAVEAFPYASAAAAVTREKIEASSPLSFGGVHRNVSTNVAPVLSPTIRNVGTANLSVGGSITNNPQSSFSTPVVVPSSVAPGASMPSNFAANQGIWVMARPTQLGSTQGTLTLTSTTDSQPVALEATGVVLYSHMLVDCSGSMSWRPDGTSTSVESETRLFQLKQAGKEVNNWIKEFSAEQAYIGLTTFPDCGSTPGPTGNVVVPIDRSINTHPSINLQYGPVAAGGLTTVFAGTPMESGIEAAVGDMDARIANTALQPNTADRPNLRQAVLLLSDGAENSGSNAASEIGGLSTKGIRMYTVGFGEPGSSNVEHALLSSLASGTGGAFFDANSLDPFGLKNAFKLAVTDWLGLNPNADPEGVIRAGQSRSHTACLDPRAYGATFIVDWDRPVAGGLSLTLQSPGGETITPSTAGVAFYSDQTFAQYILTGNRIRGGAGLGVWTLNITGNQSIPSNQDTRYSWSVLSQTPMEVEPVRKWDILTAGEYLVEVQFIGWPPPYRQQAVVTATFDAPAESFGTYLATSPIDRAWVFTPQQLGSRAEDSPRLAGILTLPQEPTAQARRVPDSIMGEPATIAQRKAWALANIAGTPFSNERATGTLQMYDDGTNGDRVLGDGIYTARVAELRHEGIHNYAISVTTPGLGLCIDRDIRLTDLVAVRLTSDLIVDNVRFAPVTQALFFDPVVGREMAGTEVPPGMVRTAAVFTPMDALGNHWGPGRADDVQFEVRDGTAVGTALDNWDGSYLQVIEHQRGTQPTVVVNAAGVTSAPITQGAAGGLPLWLWIVLILILILIVIVVVRRL